MDPNRMEMFELPNLFGHFIREFGVRWFCVIGAVVMAVIFGMRLSVALEPEPVREPVGAVPPQRLRRRRYDGAGGKAVCHRGGGAGRAVGAFGR